MSSIALQIVLTGAAAVYSQMLFLMMKTNIFSSVNNNHLFPNSALSFQVINLVGAPEQQDIELTAMYRDAVVNYGDRKVLGILASRWDDNHAIKKREAIERVSTTSETPEVTVKPEEQSDYIYHAPLPECKSIGCDPFIMN